MFKLVVNGKEYRIKFGYKALAKSDAMKQVADISATLSGSDEKTNAVLDKVGDILIVNAKLLLAGLQKYHNDEFGFDYDDKASFDSCLDKVFDFIDDYEDSTEDALSVMDMFERLCDELLENGFLFPKSEKMEETLTELNATVAPTDHLPKSVTF